MSRESQFTGEPNNYAVYVFNPNRHHISGENINKPVENRDTKMQPGDTDSLDSKPSDSDESTVCLSLLETNLEAEQETVVRCYLLKTLSVKEDLDFENEGKYVVLKFSDEIKDTFGCYYHLLSKDVFYAKNEEKTEMLNKKYVFVICLVGAADGVMESFCSELGIFCCNSLHLLDPEGLENQKVVQQRLEAWHFYGIKYIERCLETFKEDIVIIFQSALCGKIKIESKDENIKWDLERLVEACSLTSVLVTSFSSSMINIDSPSALSKIEGNEMDGCIISITAVDGKITANMSLTGSSYCQRWTDKLLMCSPHEYITLRNILESFRLKTIQDLNTLKRLLKKAENDHYSLFKAYQFLEDSGYQDVLLHHVRQEATLINSRDSLDIIFFLEDFTTEKQQRHKHCDN